MDDDWGYPWAPCFLFPEWCFSFPWGHFSRIGYFCPRGVFLFRSVFLVPRNLFFFVPGIGLSATGMGFFVPLGTFGARKGFSCARLKMKCPRVFLVPVSFWQYRFRSVV